MQSRDSTRQCLESECSQNPRPTGSRSREQLRTFAGRITGYVRLNQRGGPAGLLALRRAGHILASTLYGPLDDIPWLEGYIPSRPPIRERAPQAYVDELQRRVQFMEQHGGEAIVELLRDLNGALENGRRSIIRLPSGRKPLTHRSYLLAALAELWHRLDRRPTTGVRSRFGEFCEAVFVAIGWSTEGVNSALPDAINLWRSRYR